MIAGDNPIYAVNSDMVIPISVPYSNDSVQQDYINIYPGPTRDSCCIDKKETSCSIQLASSTKPSLSANEHFQGTEGPKGSVRSDYINVYPSESCRIDEQEKCCGIQVATSTESNPPSADEWNGDTQAKGLKDSVRQDYINVIPGPSRHSCCIDEKETSCGIQPASGRESNVHFHGALSTSHLALGMQIVEATDHSKGVKEISCVVHHTSCPRSSQTADSAGNCYENV